MAGVHSPEGWGVPQLKDEWMNIPSAPRVPQAHEGDLLWQPPVQMGLLECATSVKGIFAGRNIPQSSDLTTWKEEEGAFMDTKVITIKHLNIHCY